MEDTLKISKKLQKILESNKEDPETIIRYMERLNSIEMTLNILTKTGIGLIINKFRKKCKDCSVIAVAKQLIKQWKKLVPNAKTTKRQRLSDDHSPSRDSENGSSEDEKPNGEKRIRLESSESANENSNHSSIISSRSKDSTNHIPPKPKIQHNTDTSDPFRIKARVMISQALESGHVPEGSYDTEYLSVQIESAIFNVFMNSGPAYKQRVRTRVMNLRDQNNVELRLNVLAGTVSAEKLALMSSEDMASKEMKEMRKKYMGEVIHESQLCIGGGTETDLIKCPKCRESRCSYNQVQTRSADEPMTTFAFCNSCGHRWKFC